MLVPDLPVLNRAKKEGRSYTDGFWKRDGGRKIKNLKTGRLMKTWIFVLLLLLPGRVGILQLIRAVCEKQAVDCLSEERSFWIEAV